MTCNRQWTTEGVNEDNLIMCEWVFHYKGIHLLFIELFWTILASVFPLVSMLLSLPIHQWNINGACNCDKLFYALPSSFNTFMKSIIKLAVETCGDAVMMQQPTLNNACTILKFTGFSVKVIIILTCGMLLLWKCLLWLQLPNFMFIEYHKSINVCLESVRVRRSIITHS